MFAWLKSWGKKASEATAPIPDATQSDAPETVARPAHPPDHRITTLSGWPSNKSAASGTHIAESVEPIIGIDLGPTRATAAQAGAVAARIKRRWRWRTAGLAAVLLLLVASVTAGALWLRHRREALREDVGTALTQAARLRESGQFQESRGLLEEAQTRLGTSGPSDLVDQVNMALADTRLVERLDTARQWLFDNLDAGSPLDLTETEREYATTLSEAVLVREGEDKEVIAARVRNSSVRAELLAAILDWAAVTKDEARRAWLLAVACAADPDPERDRLRRPELWRDRPALARLGGEPVPQSMSPELAVALWRRAIAANVTEPLQLLVEAQKLHPRDYWLNFTAAWHMQPAKKWDEAMVYDRAALAIRPRAPAVHFSLGQTLRGQRKYDEAIESYQEALRLDPKSANAHNGLGVALHDKGKPDEALKQYQEALGINPKHVWAQVNLGAGLAAKGQVDEAIRNYEAALRINPNHAGAHYNYGNALRSKNKLDEAIGHYNEALRIVPRYAAAHNALGIALQSKNQLDQAIAHFELAIQNDQNNAILRVNLGNALRLKNRLDEAIIRYQQAVDIDSKNASAQIGLGNAFGEKGKLDDAISHYRLALKIDENNTVAQNGLGSDLLGKGKLDESIFWLEKAIKDGKNASANSNLGMARLYGQGRVADAVDHFERAVQIDPKNAIGHFNLGQSLLFRGRFTEARDAVRRSLELVGPGNRWRDNLLQTMRELQDCEGLAALDARLPAILEDKEKPATAAEALKFAWLCQSKLRFAAAARLYAESFAEDPKPADDLSAGFRYHAATCAALAAAGWGQDSPKPGDEERSCLRGQALEWLRADLPAWQKQLDKGNAEMRSAAQRALYRWQIDFRLFAVREKEELAKLQDRDRTAWEKLWADAEALQVKSQVAR